jgi:myo-inositol-1(or 4)-monophosphatase
MIDLDDLLSTAHEAAAAGAEVLRRYFRNEDLEVGRKGENDFVTSADHESEAAILGVIRARFPEHEILAEEAGLEPSTGSDYQWLVDPLDGTSNFMQGLPVYAVSVACRYRRRMVAGVVLDPEGGNRFLARRGGGATWNDRPIHASSHGGLEDAFLATGFPFKAHGALDRYLDIFREVFLLARSVRRCGAAALDLAYTAAGVYDGFFEFRLSPWDIAAGTLLIEEAGGRVTDLDGGDDFFRGGNVIAGGEAVWRELQQVASGVACEADLDREAPLQPAEPGVVC